MSIGSSKVLSLVAACMLFAFGAQAEPIIIDHTTLIDGTGRAPRQDMSVVIDGGRFTVVGPSILAQGLPGRRIDGRGKFLIPGLMDIHIHLAGFSRAGQSWVPSTKPAASG